MVRQQVFPNQLLKIRGNEVHCLIKDENVAKMAKELGVTRSIAAMRTFGKQLEGPNRSYRQCSYCIVRSIALSS